MEGVFTTENASGCFKVVQKEQTNLVLSDLSLAFLEIATGKLWERSLEQEKKMAKRLPNGETIRFIGKLFHQKIIS